MAKGVWHFPNKDSHTDDTSEKDDTPEKDDNALENPTAFDDETLSTSNSTPNDSDQMDDDHIHLIPRLLSIHQFTTTTTTTSTIQPITTLPRIPSTTDNNPFATVSVPIDVDISDPFQGQWPSWNTRRRMVSLRRWKLDMEWGWGTLTRWPTLCEERLVMVINRGSEAVASWIAEENKQVVTGRLMLGYLGRVMKGQLSPDTEE